MDRATGHGGNRRVRGVTQLEATLLLLLASPLVALGSHGLQARVLRARAQEAIDNVGSIYRGAVAYYEAEHNTRVGRIIPKQVPRRVGPTPALAVLRSAKGRPMAAHAQDWADASWYALSFQMEAAHRYVYEFASAYGEELYEPPYNQAKGLPNAFTARAIGDLDGDHVFSTFERWGWAGEGAVIAGPLVVQGELE